MEEGIDETVDHLHSHTPSEQYRMEHDDGPEPYEDDTDDYVEEHNEEDADGSEVDSNSGSEWRVQKGMACAKGKNA
eukprot:263998-Prymnesium_polylepis.1